MRFLGLRPHEWDRLPWWEQAIYQEGLHAEAPWIGRTVMLNKADDPLDTRDGLFGNPFHFEDDDEGSAEDLAGLGITVRRSDKPVPLYRPASG